MSGGGSVPQPYMPKGQGLADMNFMSLFGGEMPWAQGAASTIIPQLYSAAESITNNPYANTLQQGANQASAWAMGPGTQILRGGATNLSNAGNQLSGQIPGVLAYGNDPQNRLYNQTSQQTMDQQNAINAMSGTAGSPYGAGVTAQDIQNFNLAWGNNQLGRMSQADATASGLSGAAGQAYGGAGQLAEGATALSFEGGQLPYQAYNMPKESSLNAWNQAASGVNAALAPENALMNELATYMGIGQGATGLAQQGQQQGWDQNWQMWSGLGQLAENFGLIPSMSPQQFFLQMMSGH